MPRWMDYCLAGLGLAFGPALLLFVFPTITDITVPTALALGIAFISLPILPMFRSVLGADCLLLGFAGPNCNAHGPNENIVLDDMERAWQEAKKIE